MPKRAKTRRKTAGDAEISASAVHSEADADETEADSTEQGGVKPILPLFQRGGEWFIDSSEISADCPEWGPYGTKAEANEDRRPSFRRKIRMMRRTGLTYDQLPVE